MDEGEFNLNGQQVSAERVLDLLRDGEVEEIEGRLPWGSNYTLLTTVRNDDLQTLAVYKPQRGERPLWDFPDGTLCFREVAAYLVSEALGWHLVPPTVLREGPYGLGMLQQSVDADPNVNYFNLGDAFRPMLQQVAFYDHIVNNADRKGGHCLVDGQQRLWSIDHGICFHTSPKLRTVIWDFAGESIPASLQTDVRQFCGQLTEDGSLREKLDGLLNAGEVAALHQRAQRLLDGGTYPLPGPGRNYPWPPI